MAKGGEEEQEGKETNIWTKKIFGPRRRKRTELAKGESFGEGKLMVTPSWRCQPTDQPGENRAICLF